VLYRACAVHEVADSHHIRFGRGSNTNMVLAVVLITFLFVVGPTVFILNTFT
jgi:choline-glycine betaine transporter